MAKRYLVFLAVLVFASAGAYFIGFRTGKRDMDIFCGYAIRGSSAGDHTLLFEKNVAALQAVREGNSASAEKILRFNAASDAARILECMHEQQCLILMGVQPPPESQLREVSGEKH